MRRMTVTIGLALLLLGGAARAASWSRHTFRDPFTDTENITVVDIGQDGGGVIARCYERKLSVELILGPSFGNGERVSQMQSSFAEATYRLRIDQNPVTRGTVQVANVGQRDGQIAMPITSGRNAALAKALMSGKRLAYQFVPPDGTLFQVSLVGAEKFVGDVVKTCSGQWKAQREKAAAQRAREAAKEKREAALRWEKERIVRERRRVKEKQELAHQRREAIAKFRKHSHCHSVRGRAELNAAKKRYVSAVRDRIERNWVRPPGSQRRVKCAVRIVQSVSGQVISQNLESSCGGQRLNLSVRNAVRRTATLPLPTDCSLFNRVIVLEFNTTGD